VEAQECDAYAASNTGVNELLVLPFRDQGLTATRNWIWDHAQSLGVERFWTMDDNIQGFYRLWRNTKFPFGDGTFLRCMEDFVDRYENIVISGMQYEFFSPRRNVFPPFRFNARVYSNMLIQTNALDSNGEPYRNFGLNDDTDLNLRVLKDGHCTALFNAFMANKIATMRVKGGMTSEYQPGESGKKEDDGRWIMAEALRKRHPDVTTITRKWGRWQHQVDYSPFKNNKPILRAGVSVPKGTDNYGMKLKKKS
tara:strand:- start:2117 stop:2875 length:759 start_codon:yes stop_codon:yes gene_type:complete